MIKEQTNTSAIERQLDEPAPILVWRAGGSPTRKQRNPKTTPKGPTLVFPTEDDAYRGRAKYNAEHPGFAVLDIPPYRTPLIDVIAHASAAGQEVHLVDGNLNIIEVYR